MSIKRKHYEGFDDNIKNKMHTHKKGGGKDERALWYDWTNFEIFLCIVI